MQFRPHQVPSPIQKSFAKGVREELEAAVALAVPTPAPFSWPQFQLVDTEQQTPRHRPEFGPGLELAESKQEQPPEPQL
jgi:cytochrome c-type biogenesis protein CcmH/NrfG